MECLDFAWNQNDTLTIGFYVRNIALKVSKTLINTYVPMFRHRIASQTEKNIKKQAEINLSGHFLHSCFEST